MLLSYNEIVKLLDNGVVENFDPAAINGASLDVHLGHTVLLELEPADWWTKTALDYAARDAINTLPLDLRRTPNSSVLLRPGAFALAHTREVFNLPPDIAIEYKLKSSMARMALDHLNAGWGDPRWHGSALTLEFKNQAQYHSMLLRMGDPVGQIVFFRCEPVPEERSYAARGRYNNDGQTAQPARMKA